METSTRNDLLRKAAFLESCSMMLDELHTEARKHALRLITEVAKYVAHVAEVAEGQEVLNGEEGRQVTEGSGEGGAEGETPHDAGAAA
jgi:hypothetical protein